MYNIPVFTDLFQIAATTLNVDIIIIEVTQKLPYPIKRPSINDEQLPFIYRLKLYTPDSDLLYRGVL
jgi:hypothetical protein